MQADMIGAQPEVRELTETTDKLAAIATEYRVQNADGYTAAGERLKEIKTAAKRLDDLRRSMTRPLDEAKRAIMDFFRAPEEKLARAESGIKRAMVEWSDEQERIRREEQRRLDEEARKAREKAEAAARAEREKAEAAAAELRRQAEQAAAAGRAAEAAKLAARAEVKVEKADVRASALEQQAVATVAPVVIREPPKVAGVSTRENWKFDIVDANVIPREYLAVDEAKIRKVVAALKGDTRIAGVRVYSERALAAGRA